MKVTLRDILIGALEAITSLERGVALCNAPIEDLDQKRELLAAKKYILEALDKDSATAEAPVNPARTAVAPEGPSRTRRPRTQGSQ